MKLTRTLGCIFEKKDALCFCGLGGRLGWSRVRGCLREESQTVKTKPKWKAREGDVLKINTADGYFDPRSRSGGWGFVVRDLEGEMMGADAGKLSHVFDAFHAEAEACSDYRCK
jgi:hypothetical protein